MAKQHYKPRRVQTSEQNSCAGVAAAYFPDSSVFLVPHKLPCEQWRQFNKLNGGTERFNYIPFRGGYLLYGHQPTPEALAYLDEVIDAMPCGVELAGDKPAKDREDALRQAAWINKHAIMLHTRRGSKRSRGDVFYWQRGRIGRGLAVYGDRVSKITGLPTCHIELRLAKARRCRKAGIHTASDLAKIDIGLLMREHLKFFRCSSNRFGQMIEDWLRKKYPSVRRRAAAARQMRRRMELRPDQAWHEATAQDIKHNVTDYIWRKCMVEIDPCEVFPIPDQQSSSKSPTSNHDLCRVSSTLCFSEKQPVHGQSKQDHKSLKVDRSSKLNLLAPVPIPMRAPRNGHRDRGFTSSRPLTTSFGYPPLHEDRSMQNTIHYQRHGFLVADDLRSEHFQELYYRAAKRAGRPIRATKGRVIRAEPKGRAVDVSTTSSDLDPDYHAWRRK